MIRRVRVSADVEAAFAPVAALADVIPVDVDAAAARDLPAWRATEFLAARALLRTLVGDDAGPLAARPSGQPYLPERPDLAVSLSHSGGHVAAAFGRDVAVGIDIQVEVPVTPAVLRLCCTPAVRRALAQRPSTAREAALAWIWTVQEACVKATGDGLAGRPWTIPVEWPALRGRWRGHVWRRLPADGAPPLSIAHQFPTPSERPAR